MPFYDPLEAKFANRPLDAWQLSKRNFDFDMGFVGWIQKYLETRKLPCDVVSAKGWINKSKFEGERYELCQLQWEAYQESIKPKPVLKAVVVDHVLSGGVGGDADESVADRDADVASAPLSYPEPELPDEFARLEGESGREYAARMMRISREKIKSIGSW